MCCSEKKEKEKEKEIREREGERGTEKGRYFILVLRREIERDTLFWYGEKGMERDRCILFLYCGKEGDGEGGEGDFILVQRTKEWRGK